MISLVFYAWGENYYVAVMLVTIFVSYLGGVAIDYSQNKFSDKFTFAILCFFVAISLGGLAYFKYSDFILSNLGLEHHPVHLPIGISFFTFQAISYLVDIYRKDIKAEPSLINLGMYKSFFPQLIAGPIVRYHDVATQITRRGMSSLRFYTGVKRFVWGLGKKVIIANPLAAIADLAFNSQTHELSSLSAWIGIICYSLQIYYDFSGYSDMAIGMGKMFGFDFLENFNYPYISKSIQEFWRRWHISLSSWFKDYVYIPLGGSKVSTFKIYRNLFIVFFLTGFWHGASWNFIVWGMFHGLFIILERLFLRKQVLDTVPPVFNHVYVILIVMLGWVFFRANDITHALEYIQCLFITHPESNNNILFKLDHYNLTVLVVALLFISPLKLIITKNLIKKRVIQMANTRRYNYSLFVKTLNMLLISCVFIWSCMQLAASSYNPFIYFRF